MSKEAGRGSLVETSNICRGGQTHFLSLLFLRAVGLLGMLCGLEAPPESLLGGGCTDRLTAFGNGYDSGGHQVVDSFATCLLPFSSFLLFCEESAVLR